MEGEERGLALHESAQNMAIDFPREDWSALPPELLELIGSKITEGAHLQSASMVCKSWSASIATGLTSMEVDMHSDPALWRAKVEKLQSLIRHLRSCIIHVNTKITDEMLFQNIALVQQLKGISELKLLLRDGCDLPPAAAAAIGSMRHLTSLSIIGGGLTREAAVQLLGGLAANAATVAAATTAAAIGASGDGRAGGGLRSLTLLPAVQHGLGDEEMGVLAACCSLEVLEFRAYRLTSAGLATLSLGLPRLSRLAITSLDSDSGYELACLERLSALAELDLALDQAPTGAASRRALCAVKPGRSLSLSFRWTDRAQVLLAECGKRLSNLTHLDVGACRVGSESLFEAVAQLTGLRELRMAVYSNADQCIPCHLSRLSALAALQRFHLEKRKAYFPEARRFAESSIAVPVTSDGLRSLAERWSRLRALRLALSRKDYSPEALTVLSSFTGLRELGIVVERFPVQHQQQHGAVHSQDGHAQGAAAQQHQHQEAGSATATGSSCSLSRLSRRGLLELPPLVDLVCLPAGLESLELNNVLLDLSPGPGPGPGTGLEPIPHPGPVEGQGPGQSDGAGTEGRGPGVRVGGERDMGTTSLGPHSGRDGTLSGPGPHPSVGGFGCAAATAAAAATATPLPPLPLSLLTSLDVEACVVRPPLLSLVAARCGGRLQSLRLVGVVGLSDGALADCLAALPALRSLTVSASGNRAVSQAGLAALSAFGRRPPLLRQLVWETDDLTSRGPDLRALAPLTSLRHLYLSCNDKTAVLALGSLTVLQDALPYCHVDMVWTASRPEGI